MYIVGEFPHMYLYNLTDNNTTGLDPAGPRFVDGPYVDAIPELAENIISKESAAFVDIIHTNGAFEPCVVCTECKWGELLELAAL